MILLDSVFYSFTVLHMFQTRLMFTHFQLIIFRVSCSLIPDRLSNYFTSIWNDLKIKNTEKKDSATNNETN